VSTTKAVRAGPITEVRGGVRAGVPDRVKGALAEYVIWLLPLVPLSAGGVWGLGVSAVFLAVCWMTTQTFPFHYLEFSAGRSPGTDILLGRNQLLLVLWGLMPTLPSGRQSPESVEDTVSKRVSPV
jgi:hypothetical protein